MRHRLAGVLFVILGAAAGPAVAQGVIAPVPVDHDAWFQSPCLPDSSDDFTWTRYDLHGVRIRIPPGVRQVKVPNVDELHFRAGRGTLRLRLHLDASSLFAQYNMPHLTHRHCTDGIAGWLAEAISFRSGTRYGFAVRWADADRGEWLTAVVLGPTASEATYLRRALFTIQFPGERRPGRF